MDSVRRFITRASAYRAPAASAASTAAVAAANCVMVHSVSRNGLGRTRVGVRCKGIPAAHGRCDRAVIGPMLWGVSQSTERRYLRVGRGPPVVCVRKGAALMSDTTTSGDRGIRATSQLSDPMLGDDTDLSV